ncbi:hypothetical protein GUJ93_ZPchr0001g32500 [Zizania palustris]|uniref:Inhibitor I9 domain-containing protein n=1 Tax=Zizania palustris TaxID=103762 RepID=A0A8J5SBD1_ZIZPA|nr:hypothetical protein GUJ93_ZPchr0001g32500 [Zizania palustris]
MEMLTSVVVRGGGEQGTVVALTQSYHHAFEGFAAELTEEEAAALSGHESVVSVFRDRALELHTTRSWDFLDVQSGLRSERLGRRASGRRCHHRYRRHRCVAGVSELQRRRDGSCAGAVARRVHGRS